MHLQTSYWRFNRTMVVKRLLMIMEFRRCIAPFFGQLCITQQCHQELMFRKSDPLNTLEILMRHSPSFQAVLQFMCYSPLAIAIKQHSDQLLTS